MKKTAGMEMSSSGIGVSTSARVFARKYYASQGNTVWPRVRNDKLNDLLSNDFSNSLPEHRYLLRSGEVAEIRKSGTFVYFAAMRRGTYDIIVLQQDYKKPAKPEISERRLENLNWSKKMSSYKLYKKLEKLANRLDRLGAYDEAAELDKILKSAAEYPGESKRVNVTYTLPYDSPPEVMEDITDPDELEELSGKALIRDKMRQGYDPEEDLLIKMREVLQRGNDHSFDESYDYEDSPYDDDDAEDKQLSELLQEPSAPEPDMPELVMPSVPPKQIMPKTFEPSGPAR